MRLESNQQCRKAEDLQSSGVTSFPTHPYMVEQVGFEPTRRIADFRVTAGCPSSQASTPLIVNTLRLRLSTDSESATGECILKHIPVPGIRTPFSSSLPRRLQSGKYML